MTQFEVLEMLTKHKGQKLTQKQINKLMGRKISGKVLRQLVHFQFLRSEPSDPKHFNQQLYWVE